METAKNKEHIKQLQSEINDILRNKLTYTKTILSIIHNNLNRQKPTMRIGHIISSRKIETAKKNIDLAITLTNKKIEDYVSNFL